MVCNINELEFFDVLLVVLGIIIRIILSIFPYLGNFIIPTDGPYFSEGWLNHQSVFVMFVSALGPSVCFWLHPALEKDLADKR